MILYCVSAAICGTTTKTVRLPNGVGIFRAELYAITMALNIIYRKKENNFIIFSDCMSSLQAVKSFKLELDLIYQIIKDYSHLTESGKSAGYQVMQIYQAMRRLTLQPGLFSRCQIPK